MRAVTVTPTRSTDADKSLAGIDPESGALVLKDGVTGEVVARATPVRFAVEGVPGMSYVDMTVPEMIRWLLAQPGNS